jgi:hypothetical protein
MCDVCVTYRILYTILQAVMYDVCVTYRTLYTILQAVVYDVFGGMMYDVNKPTMDVET